LLACRLLEEGGTSWIESNTDGPAARTNIRRIAGTTVVLTHRRPDDRPEDDDNFVFVTEGIEAAVTRAKESAGDRNVVVNGGQMARQCLEAGLLDEVGVELVPVVLGGGTPLFAGLSVAPVQFDGPVTVVGGTGVTHLRYRVRK
jgi:dihydrofolate reductase